ncbi:protein cytosolic protein [Thermococcus sp. M36]|uniref:protein cytosolic protein n=1 Tax=Thermococcus sp. M36 TaxID=1638261 RepID=UPI0014397D1E|nr:protein cytosolic protein [Thermococcus sp. M36]NJE04868.1 protein cytosolic protein [Thermococcus sp. M36]
MRRRKIVALSLGLLVMLPLFWTVFSTPVEASDYTEVKVAYYRTLPFKEPEAKIILPSRGVNTVTVLGMLPNGTPVDLGTYAGGESIKMDYRRIERYLRIWEEHLKKARTDPSFVNPGIVLLGTAHRKDGLGYFVRGVPLNLGEVLKRRSFRVSVLNGFRTLLSSKEIERLKSREGNTATGKTIGADSFPPGFFPEECYPGPYGTSVCFDWVLEEVYDTEDNTVIPLAAAFLNGDVGEIDDVYLRERFQSSRVLGVEIGFSAVAAVDRSGTGASYEAEIVGMVYTLKGDHLWLKKSVRFRGEDIRRPTVVGIGIKGDIALAKYRLYGPYGPLDVTMYVVMAQPEIRNGRLISVWGKEDGAPSRYGGTFRKAMYYIERYWKPGFTVKSKDFIEVNNFDVSQSVSTLPLFSVAAPVLPKLNGPLGTDVYPVLLSTGVGVTKYRSEYALVGITVGLEHRYREVSGTFYKSPVRFEYDGEEYWLSSMYADVTVFPSFNPRCNPRTGVCPEDGETPKG